jgi:uncharacterized protein with PQ loop repeat
MFKLKKLFNQPFHQHTIDHIGNLNGLVSGITLYPQLFHALNARSLEGLSFTTFVLIFLNSAIWIAYAIHRKLPALLISSVLNAFSSLGITILIFIQIVH